jgi:hypothetical protein
MPAQKRIRNLRKQAEQYLRSHLSTIPANVGMHGTALRLLQASGAAPVHGRKDYALLALDPRVALDFNPFLSEQSVERLQGAAVLWLQLCVLEDRLQRLAGLVGDPSSTAALIQVSHLKRIIVNMRRLHCMVRASSVHSRQCECASSFDVMGSYCAAAWVGGLANEC